MVSTLRGLKLPGDWVEKADVFLSDAERHLTEGHYWLVCFEAHQAAELYLKSLIVSLTGFYPYTHDLFELANTLKALELEIEDDVLVACDALTPHYTLSRYPGRKAITYTRERAEKCLLYSKRIITWVKRTADP